jgi:hypothetical protein
LRNWSPTLRLGLAAVAACLLTGCSAFGSLSASTVTITPSHLPPLPAAITTPSAFPTPPTPLSGSQLARVLLPASAMPAGFASDPSVTGDSGSQSPSDTPQPVPAGQLCAAFTQTGFIRAAGISTSDFAQGDYVNNDKTGEIDEEIDIFTGGDAEQAMTALWQEFGRCASFSYQYQGTNAPSTLTRSRLPGTGDGAIKAVIVSSPFEGGETIVAVRVGSQVITTLDSSAGNDLGAAAVGYAERIVRRLHMADQNPAILGSGTQHDVTTAILVPGPGSGKFPGGGPAG